MRIFSQKQVHISLLFSAEYALKHLTFCFTLRLNPQFTRKHINLSCKIRPSGNKCIIHRIPTQSKFHNKIFVLISNYAHMDNDLTLDITEVNGYAVLTVPVVMNSLSLSLSYNEISLLLQLGM